MHQVSAVLERVDRVAQSTWVHHVATPLAHGLPTNDDDLIDEFLASVSVDEFEAILNGLASLR